MKSEDLAHPEDALLGRVVAGKFSLRRCVGAGASGAVYQADQIALGRTVAVKILRPELARDARFVNRFHAEALAASRLNHPNVVSVIDYGQTEDGLLYLVMEFLRGPTLTQVLRGEQLGATRIADMVSQILGGLEEAHDAGVIHADLKADNVVVEHRRGDWDLVKVVDFGIARLVGSEDGASEKTICGTPEYMAPEVISGGESTFACDLYAAGVVLYELLTGVTPFVGGSSMEVLRRHLAEAPLPPRQRRPDRTIDERLEAIALRALAKRPDDRYPSATAFRAALLGVLAQQPVGDQVLCGACGVSSAVAFKFCPECGQPRTRQAATSEIQVSGRMPRETAEAPPPAAEVSGDKSTFDLPPLLMLDGVQRPTSLRAVGGASGILPLPFFGRADELRRVSEFLAGPAAMSVLQIVGPAGSGRTRIVREAIAAQASEPARVVITEADPSGLARPFYPVRSAVRRLLALPARCETQELGRALTDLGLGARELPAIAELLGLQGPLWQLEPPERRREIIGATLRVLTAPAAQRRLALVFEDTDHYDGPSQEVIRRLIEAAGELPTLRVLLTTSVEQAGRWPRALLRIDLAPLPETAIHDLAERLASGGNRSMPSAELLIATCGGLAGHIHQLVRFAVEGGVATEAPAGLADLIAARLDLLPRTARLLCQAAAVLGYGAESRSLRAVIGEQLGDGEVADGLSILAARGLVVPDDGAGLHFEEMLVRDVTYDGTPADVRRALHAAAFAAQRDGADDAVLGHHAFLAGELEQAADLLARAGDDAEHELDHIGARGLYNRALSAARQRMLADDDPAQLARFIRHSTKLSSALRAGGELGLARGVIEEAALHCEESRPLRLELLRASAQLSAAEGDEARTAATLREAIGGAIVTGDRELLCTLYLDLATFHARRGNPQLALRELEEAIDLLTLGEGARAADASMPVWRLLQLRDRLS